MGLIENEQIEQKNKKNKILMIIISIIIVILIVVSGVLIYTILTYEDTSLKLTINNQSTNFASDMFVNDNGNIYIDIRAFASLLGYETYNGDLKTRYSEDTSKCYIRTSDEAASYELNSNTIYKKVTNNEDYEYFDLVEPVKLINNKLYVIERGMEIGTNCMIEYNATNNLIQVVSLDYLVSFYSNQFSNSAIADEEADFNNKKALLYNMIVVQNAEAMYGVYTTDGSEIIGAKYTGIKFNEGSQEFTVTTEEGNMGILTTDGATKIEPAYASIKQISTELNYYLVGNNDKYGVINQNGNIVIYLEYDDIGIDESRFNTNSIDNPYILFDNCIPVERDGKWGLIDISGKIILPIQYDSIGCLEGAQNNTSSNNVVIIPKYELIVVGLNEKYGLADSQGNILLEPVLDSIYSITSSGENKHFMILTRQELQGGRLVDVQETLDLDEYLDQNLGTQSEEQQNNNSQEQQTNEIVNETTNNTVEDTNMINEQNNINTNVA